jgi:hypothetical protein
MRNVVLIFVVFVALVSCVAGKKAEGPGSYAIEQEVPQIIAVLPASMEAAQAATDKGEIDPEDAEFVCGLTRNVLHNHLAGKGYQPILMNVVDRKLHDHPEWKTLEPKELCKLLGVRGVVYVDVSGWAMVNIAAIENFMLSAGARMVGASGREIGNWVETSDKHKFSIPTSLEGIAGTILGAFLSDSPQKQFRHVAYDWGWKMSQIMPDCIEGQSLPEIMLVDSNVDVGTFGVGDKVAVKVFAEKDLVGSFDIGGFRENIPLKVVGEGEYEGYYVVRENDRTKDQVLTVRMARLNGAEREWTEAEALVSVDGVPPKKPVKTTFQAQNDGVHMDWSLPGGEEIAAFVIERNDRPVGQFAQMARIEDAWFVDGEVEQGSTYYYRIRSVDKARNLSKPCKPVEVVMPRFDELTISGELTGSLITGNYFVDGDASVPAGEVLTVMKGTKLTFSEGAGLIVRGKLLVKGDREAPVLFGGEKWRGVAVEPGGEAEIGHASFAGCAGMVTSSGKLLMDSVDGKGDSGDGVVLLGGTFELSDVDLIGWAQGVVVIGGEGVLAKSTLTGNEIGVVYRAGELELDHNNIYGNERNIQADRQLAVRENFLGATKAAEARVSEKVILKSVLDAPHPDGRVIALMEDEDLSAEQIAKRFEGHKARGVELFNGRKYGDAYAELSKAVRYKADRDTYLYLAYTQMELGEANRAGKTLESGIEAFPYDYRLHQVYVRHLLAQGNDGRAMSVVDAALKFDPGNANLQFLKEYIDEEVKKMRSVTSEGSR